MQHILLATPPAGKVKSKVKLAALLFILSGKEWVYCQCTVNLDLFMLESCGNAITHAFNSSSMFTEIIYSYCWSYMTFTATMNCGHIVKQYDQLTKIWQEIRQRHIILYLCTARNNRGENESWLKFLRQMFVGFLL